MISLKRNIICCKADVKILFYLLLVFNYSCFSKNNQPENLKLKATVLKTDFKILRKTLEEAHPGLYWYSGKTEMDNYFDSTSNLINKNMTRIKFYKLLLSVIAKIKCVHTNIRLPKDVSNGSMFYNILPFDFYCRNGKTFITKAYGTIRYEGLEILSINNITTKEIIGTLLNSLPADGFNETFKYQLLSSGAFREGYALYFGQPDSFIIKAIGTDKKPFVFTVKAKIPKELIDIKKLSSQTPIHLSFMPGLSTAIFQLNTFEINTKKFRDTLLTIFKNIKDQNSKHLIIDLRQNGGGNNDNVSALFSFIASEPFLHLKRAEMNAPGYTYSPYFNNFKVINNLNYAPDTSGKYLVNYRYAGTSLTHPGKDNLFKGDVIILTSGNTTSAASEFAAISHFTKRAKIVGEETGGCYYGATGGNYINLILPGSGFEVRIPTIRIFTAVNEDYLHQPKGRGTIPDYEVIPASSVIINTKDVQLDSALKIIKTSMLVSNKMSE